MKWNRKSYGVNVISKKKIYVNLIDSNDDKSKYDYTVDIVPVSEHNGNGIDNMRIYTKNKLDILKSGDWTIYPIIKMPYCWQGYDVCIDIEDIDETTHTIRKIFDSTSLFRKGGFSNEIEGVLKTVFSLKDFVNVDHFKIEEEIIRIKERINKNSPLSFSSETSFRKEIENLEVVLQKEDNKIFADKVNGKLEDLKALLMR